MKNTSRFLIAAALLTIAGTSQLQAQTVQLNESVRTPARYNDLASTDDLSGRTTNFVKSRALRDFSKRATFAVNDQWYRFTDGYLVKYEDMKGISCRTDYDKLGNWISTTRYYGKELLAGDLRSIIGSIYLDFTITTIQEINFPKHTVYIIHMYSHDRWQNVQVANGEVKVLEERQKTTLN